MPVEMNEFLDKEARLACEFYSELDKDDEAELLNLVASFGKDHKKTQNFVSELIVKYKKTEAYLQDSFSKLDMQETPVKLD